ncbi:putative lipoprotein [Leadbettera azotonutricia ZAS-9]|uniref:Putative lipoprotein n=1 Tax=Leadbettera azotonutricia (strain ATCC BAA-888 / DSM 13862 / ZAS-9) TaxID=545695 RepID=F5Y8J8_LEAAZ|nr:putative lipoprotein [Leadbettera azotonutricia ZAS-9]
MLTIPLLIVLSCASAPAAVEAPVEPATAAPVQVEPAAPAAPATQPPAPADDVFKPESVSQEVRDTTLSDVQKLIQDLNQIIRAQNYNSWVGHLSVSYMTAISSPAYLAERTEELYKRDQAVASRTGKDPKRVRKVELKSARDYFINIVVPARKNDRVDDIEFISENQVKAYRVDNSGQRDILYNLEKTDGDWKITN